MLRDYQHERICETLCNAAGFTGCWNRDGVTPKGRRLQERDIGLMSSGEAILVRTAFDVWNSSEQVPLGRLINVLDCRNLRMVGELLVVLAAADTGKQEEAAEAWLQKYAPAATEARP